MARCNRAVAAPGQPRAAACAIGGRAFLPPDTFRFCTQPRPAFCRPVWWGIAPPATCSTKCGCEATNCKAWPSRCFFGSYVMEQMAVECGWWLSQDRFCILRGVDSIQFLENILREVLYRLNSKRTCSQGRQLMLNEFSWETRILFFSYAFASKREKKNMVKRL